jgi:hypothetical protein
MALWEQQERARADIVGAAEKAGAVVRVVGATLGVVCIVIGLVWAITLFTRIRRAAESPEQESRLVERWGEALGGDELSVVVEGARPVPLARPAAVGVLGGAALLCCWLALGLLLCGAKLVSWTLGDREAVKRVLRHAFGATLRPPEGASTRPAGEE